MAILSGFVYQLHTLRIERKPVLGLLSINSLSGSKEGRDGQHMTPEHLNKECSCITMQDWWELGRKRPEH